MFILLWTIVRRIIKLGIRNILHPLKYYKSYTEQLNSVSVNELFKDPKYILSNVSNVDSSLIDKYPTCSEVEHQVGRYINMKTIAQEIESKGVPGDIVEFGVWQGLSLLLLSKTFQNQQPARKFIGIDSFKGLPETSTIWREGAFGDTSYESVQSFIDDNSHNRQSFHLISGWFDDPSVVTKLSSLTSDIALVHFDADLGSSTSSALRIVSQFLKNLSHPIYFLFDDWGCHPDEVPDAFHHWFKTVSDRYFLRAEKISTTRYTRYYRIEPSNLSRNRKSCN